MSVDQQLDNHKRLVAASAVVSAYVGSDALKAVVEMLDRLVDSYYMDLIEVTPERLQAVQAAAKQATALRRLMTGKAGEIPKI